MEETRDQLAERLFNLARSAAEAEMKKEYPQYNPKQQTPFKDMALCFRIGWYVIADEFAKAASKLK